METSLLTSNQRRILEFAAKEKVITSKFFLTGGTALSYFYLKHRFSEDLDFFSEEKYDPKDLLTWVTKASKHLKLIKTEQQQLSGQSVFYMYFSNNAFVKIDFAYFPFSHLGTFIKYYNLRIASMEDIAANKIHAILTRKRARDYIDLFSCMQTLHWNPTDLSQKYRLKFDVVLPTEQLITSFINVVDAQDEPRFLGKVKYSKIKDYFLKSAQSMKKEIIR